MTVRVGSGLHKWYVGEVAPIVWEALLGKKFTEQLIQETHILIPEEREKNGYEKENYGEKS
jgi:hypothetical protein